MLADDGIANDLVTVIQVVHKAQVARNDRDGHHTAVTAPEKPLHPAATGRERFAGDGLVLVDALTKCKLTAKRSQVGQVARLIPQ